MIDEPKRRRMAVSDLRPAGYNPRTISDAALAGLGESMQRWGLVQPVIWNETTGNVVGGHQRLKVLEAEGVEEIEVVVVALPDAEEKALNVALNAPQIGGEFNDGLGPLLDEIEAELPDLYEAVLLDELRKAEGLVPDSEPPEDDEAPEPPEDPESVAGEVYQLGPHRVVCGDCRTPDTWAAVLDGLGPVNVAFTSPPYAQQRKYDEASGFRPIPPDEYGAWFEAVQANVRSHLAEDGSWFVNIKAHCEAGQRSLYVMDLVLAHVREWGWRFVDELCWTHRGLPGTWPNRFKNAWEPVYHFAAGMPKFRPLAVGHESAHAFHEGGRVSGTNRSGNQGWSQSPRYESGTARPSNVIDAHAQSDGGHSAAFPVALPAFFVKAYSDKGDVICDPFMGSGTTLIAAAQEGRTAVGMELSPAYVDVIRKRWTRWALDHEVDPGPGALE